MEETTMEIINAICDKIGIVKRLREIYNSIAKGEQQ